LGAVTKLVQSALNTVNPGLAIAAPQTMNAVVAQALGQARLMTWLLGIFAGVALLLASIGIYGAVAYTVEQRTGEIGVRMALGARPAQALALVARESAAVVGVGLLLGLGGALLTARVFAGLLFGVGPADPVALTAALVVLGTVALAATLLPARRAALVDPVVALRAE